MRCAASGAATSKSLVIRTEGDRRNDAPIDQLEGQGWFTADLERSLLDGRADVAVHSAKDLPSALAPGLSIAAYLARADARDGVVSRTGRALEELPAGATVGTSSARRAGLLAALYPRLRAVPIRGNVDTRLRKLDTGEVDALVLACAGLDRLALGERLTQRLDPFEFVPSPAQGAIALETVTDSAAHAPARRLTTPPTSIGGDRRASSAERPRRRVPPPAWRLGTGRGRPVGARRRAGRRGIDSPSRGRGQPRGSRSARRGGRGPASMTEASPPLAGRRILVTRTREQAEGLVDSLHRRGRIGGGRSADRDRPDRRARAIVAGRRRGRCRAATPVGGLHQRDRRSPGHRRRRCSRRCRACCIAAVGPATAAALLAEGATPELVASEHDADGLATAMLDRGYGRRHGVVPGRRRSARRISPSAFAQRERS